MKLNYKKRKGSAYLLIILIFLFTSMTSALMISRLNHAIHQSYVEGIQMQAYYYTKMSAEATVAALLADTEDLLDNFTGTPTQTLQHTDASGVILAESVITMRKELRDYYGTDKEWAVVNITTTIQDGRSNHAATKYTYTGSVAVLVEQPIVQIYNISP